MRQLPGRRPPWPALRPRRLLCFGGRVVRWHGHRQLLGLRECTSPCDCRSLAPSLMAPVTALSRQSKSLSVLKTLVVTPGARRSVRPSVRQSLNEYVYVLLAEMATLAVCQSFHSLPSRLARWLLMSRDRAHVGT